MAEDGSIQINTKVNTKDAEKNIKKLPGVLEKVIGSMNKLSKNPATEALGKLSMAAGGVGAAFSVVTKAVGLVADTMHDLSNAYNMRALYGNRQAVN